MAATLWRRSSSILSCFRSFSTGSFSHTTFRHCCPEGLPDLSAVPEFRLESQTEEATILDGRRGSALWLQELIPRVRSVSAALGRPPRLSVILVGNRPDSQLYVQRKAEVGIEVVTTRLDATIEQSTLQQKVAQACGEESDGVLIQLPLPRHLDEEAVTAALDPWKDVDGVHPLNMGHMLMRGHAPRFVPCTALGCIHLLKLYGVDIEHKTTVVMGDSNYVGIPLSVLLRNENAAVVSVCHGISYNELFEDPEMVQRARVEAGACHPVVPGPIDPWSIESRSNNHEQCPIERNTHLPSITQTADILVVAVGWPKLVKAHWIKPGAVVIDIGINVIPNKGSNKKAQIAGDVDFASVSKVASAISPVPGGAGPMTIAGVVHNTLQAAEYRLQNSM